MQILSIDDHMLFREGLRLILAGLAGNFLQANTCEAALEIEPNRVDVVLLDLHLPGLSGLQAIPVIKKHFEGAVLVVISGEEAPDTIRRVITGGAAGYIPKSSSPEILMAALKLVLAGGSYLPPHVLGDVRIKDERANRELTDLREPLKKSTEALSKRQKMVLSKAIQGKPNKVIADELNIAEGTVKAHLSAAYKALGAANRTEAFYVAIKYDLCLVEFN